MSGYVYFMAYDNADWRRILPVVKIGATNDVSRRLKQLNTGSPVRLVVVGIIEAAVPKTTELRLHVRFSTSRIRGEWFSYTERMRDELLTMPIKDNKFDELFELEDWKIYSHERNLAHLRDVNKELSNTIISQQYKIAALHARLARAGGK
jgi:hypothetical protein